MPSLGDRHDLVCIGGTVANVFKSQFDLCLDLAQILDPKKDANINWWKGLLSRKYHPPGQTVYFAYGTGEGLTSGAAVHLTLRGADSGRLHDLTGVYETVTVGLAAGEIGGVISTADSGNFWKDGRRHNDIGYQAGLLVDFSSSAVTVK